MKKKIKYIIKVITDTGFEKDTIHYIKIARLGRYVCGTYDLITTAFIREARKFKTKEEAQRFIDSVMPYIETYETLEIEINE